MTQLVQTLILGLLIGGVYALLASGLTLIFGVMDVINVAQGALLILAAFFAWALWLFVHVLFLIGFRNRMLVIIQWAWSYLSYDRGARLITGRAEGPLVQGLTQDRLPSTTEAEPIHG